MYHKLKDYLDLPLLDRASFLRENGYYYDIEQTKYLPDKLLADFSANNGAGLVPQMTPMQVYPLGGKRIVIACSLFLNDKIRQQFAPPRYVNDLYHITFEQHGQPTNFYDCYIQNMLNANDQLKSVLEDTFKIRLYLSFELIFLAGMFVANGIEVYVMHEFKSKSNYDRADYWRLLAFGDAQNANYTYAMDADVQNPEKYAQYILDSIEERADLFGLITPNKCNNIDDNVFSMTYLNGGITGVNNRASFFKKYKMADLLQAYYTMSTNGGVAFGGIDLYPVFANKVAQAGINIDAFSLNKRPLNDYCGDQCFLNSVLLFGMLEEGDKVSVRCNADKPQEMLSYHLRYPFNYLEYLQSKPNASVAFGLCV